MQLRAQAQVSFSNESVLASPALVAGLTRCLNQSNSPARDALEGSWEIFRNEYIAVGRRRGTRPNATNRIISWSEIPLRGDRGCI